jgi:transposase
LRKRSSGKIAERTYEKERKHFAPEEKVAILRRHLLDKVAVSDLCEELVAADGLLPRVLREGSGRLSNEGTSSQPEKKRIGFLERKVQTKDEVLADLMAEHIASEGLRVLGHFVGQELDRHEAAQVEVLRFVDHTHATTENAVVRDCQS